MPSPEIEECERCHKKALFGDEPGCRACNEPLARRAPNVRFARRLSAELEDRYLRARAEAEAKDLEDGLKELEAVAARAMAVVNVDVGMACDLFSQPKLLYTSYGKLVEAGVRAPATPDQDRQRTAVDGILYGSHGQDIAFAALSGDGCGLISWGSVHLELDEVTLDFRSSVLEDNSFHFVKRHRLVPGDPFPEGRLAPWPLRAQLAVAKLAPRVQPKMGDADCCKLLLESKGSRDTDVFLEVHIYGNFNYQAVRRVKLSSPDTSKLDDEAKEVLFVRLKWLRSQLSRLSVEWSDV